MPTVEIG